MNYMNAALMLLEDEPSMSGLISQIGSLLSSVLGWITSIYTWAIAEPLILFFIALGLAGVMIRWARVLVNFIRG